MRIGKYTAGSQTRLSQDRPSRWGKIMNTGPIKKEEELGTTVERWEYEYRELVKKGAA